jgi:hypothetical protein
MLLVDKGRLVLLDDLPGNIKAKVSEAGPSDCHFLEQRRPG